VNPAVVREAVDEDHEWLWRWLRIGWAHGWRRNNTDRVRVEGSHVIKKKNNSDDGVDGEHSMVL
jgi:hypothetical protein